MRENGKPPISKETLAPIAYFKIARSLDIVEMCDLSVQLAMTILCHMEYLVATKHWREHSDQAKPKQKFQLIS